MPGILNQMGADSINNLRRLAQQIPGEGGAGANAGLNLEDEDDDDDDGEPPLLHAAPQPW